MDIDIESPGANEADLKAALRTLVGGFAPISTHSPSAVSELDITLPSGYSSFKLIGWMVPATDAVLPALRTSSDGGSSFDSGASDYYESLWNTIGGADARTGGTASQISLVPHEVGNLATEGVEFEIIFNNVDSTTRYTTVLIDSIRHLAAGTTGRAVGSGRRSSTSAVDAVRLFFASGNITLGEVMLLGVPA